MMRQVLSILLLFLATAAVFLGVRGFYTVVQARLDPGLPYASTIPAAMENGQPVEASELPLSHFEAITRRNLFKTTDQTAEAAAQAQKNDATSVEDLEKTRLKLKLWGTVTGSGEAAFAIIEDTADKRQNLFRVGDSLKTAMVKSILRERVVLTVNGKDEALDIEKTVKSPARPGAPTPPDPMETQEPEPPPMEETPAQSVSIGREEVQGAIQNVNELMKQVRIRPHFTNGQPDGLSLSGIKPGSIFQDIGLRSGDVIIGVDGQPIQSVDDALKFYTSLKDSANVSLQIRRDGREETIKYSVE